MSRTARYLIAIVSLITASGFTWLSLFPAPETTASRWPVVVFCLLITIACFQGPGRAIATRVLGGGICLMSVLYLVTVLVNPVSAAAPSPNGTVNILNAARAFFIFGLPGGYIALIGKLPDAISQHFKTK